MTVRIVLQPNWVKGISAIADRTTATLARIPGLIVASVTPAALIALSLGLWRLTTDLEWTEWFPVSSGLLSHWQAWIALAIALKFGASALLTRAGLEEKALKHQ
ncbi:MAG TPA: hypothetical protein VEU96_14085 [Bryobacteraceae bacterium]|nr:hypothetical protein [Bryobacteraceae bacterium]